MNNDHGMKIVTVTMPDIGEGVVEGEVIAWLKNIDDPVAKDEPVVVVMTDKATVELPAPCSGKLAKQFYQPGQIAIKDKPLYEIVTTEQIAIPLSEEKKSMQKAVMPPQTIPSSKPTPSTGHVQASPPVRKLARDLGIDINQIEGSGPDGRVLQNDLVKKNKDTIEHQLTHYQDDEETPLIGIRNLMAKKMALSHQQIPPFSYFEQLDASRLVQLRYRYKAEAVKQGISVTYMPFIIKALSATLTQYPITNSCFDLNRNTVIIHKQQHIGIAITTKQGLIVPVLKHVEKMNLQELIIAYEQLKRRAQEGKLQVEDMRGATITITNFGVLGGGGLWATPIINFPEVAILGISRIQKQPVVKNDTLVIRDILNLSWSFDHRVIDGDQAATISHYLSNLLQNPAALL